MVHLLKKGIGTKSVQIDSLHDTGKVMVQIDGKGIPDFQIMKDVAYDYIEYDNTVREALSRDPALIYFGTLAQRNRVSHSTLGKMLSMNQSAKTLYDINLREDYFTKEIVEWSLSAADIVKLNEDELKTCKSLFQDFSPDKSFILSLMKRFGLEWFCLTRGDRGSELFHGQDHFATNRVPERRVIDTVGSGDAYTAILAIGILNQWEPETILLRATDFSGALCTIPGAIPEDLGFYKPYLSWTGEETNGR